MSDRGWGESCGSADPDRIPLSAKCEHGYNHLMDDRYEVRDAQYLISLLADEGVAQPQKIGATGFSYGGGISMALATLRNRTMMPDGSLVPWKSPAGTPMEIAAAVPQWPWTDLAYSLMPNGRTLDYVADAPYRGPGGTAPIGVEKASFVSLLYGSGLALSNYATPGTDSGADLTPWYGLVTAGEPYDSNPAATTIVDRDHLAPLLLLHRPRHRAGAAADPERLERRPLPGRRGDPLLQPDPHAVPDATRSPSSSWTTGTLAARTSRQTPKLFEARQNAWFDHYLKGEGPAPHSSAEALTTTCGTPSEGPYTADSWKDLAPGEIRLDSAAEQTIVPGSGDPTINLKFDPIGGEGACATASGADQAGAANYRLAAAPAAGFTLIGSPTIVADIASRRTANRSSSAACST